MLPFRPLELGLIALAMTLAALGLVLILEPWDLRATLLAKGLAVLAGVCWALGVVIFKRLHNHHPVDAFNFTFWQMALGLVPAAIGNAVFDATGVRLRRVPFTPERVKAALERA